MKHLPLLLLFLLAGCSRTCPAKFSVRGGEVTSTGLGEIRIAPDLARFTVEVAFTKPTLKEAVDETQKIMDQVVAACRKTISDSNDVQTLRISVNKEFEWVNNANVFKGFAANQSVEVTLRDLSKMEALTAGILATQISGINNLEFDHSRADSLRAEAGALAMMNARENVQKMCLAVNKTCEELVSARSADAVNPGPVFDRGFSGTMAAKAAPNGISVKPGLLTFSAGVIATYRSK